MGDIILAIFISIVSVLTAAAIFICTYFALTSWTLYLSYQSICLETKQALKQGAATG